jgi:Transposase IS4
MMCLGKADPRGTMKMAYCKDERIAAFQWQDSKTVNCVSSYLHFGVSTIKRQHGSVQKRYPCPTALVHYQENMGTVDRVDQMRSHFGGFAAQSHFKKWYKKTIMAVLDCMLINGLVRNLSCNKIGSRRKMNRSEFLQVVAHELLHYKTESLVSPGRNASARGARTTMVQEHNEDLHVSVACIGKRPRCAVCNLETSQYLRTHRLAKKNQNDTTEEAAARQLVVKKAYEGVKKRVSTCQQCGVFAHNDYVVDNRKYIHRQFPPGMLCMQIMHSPTGKEIWNVRGATKKVSVNYKHPVVKEVRLCVRESMMRAETNED